MTATKITLREVALRDGLQGVQAHLQTSVKCDWILLASAAGVRHVEVGAFVAATRLPEIADTAEVVAFARTEPGLAVSVMVRDFAGAQRALAAAVEQLSLPIAASESHNRANVGKASAKMLDELRHIRVGRDASNKETRIEVAIGTAFGCALEGAVAPAKVARLVDDSLAAGADGVILADSFGYARPAAVRESFSQAIRLAGVERLSGHFHATEDGGVANVMAACELGVTRFDASLAGIGGCAFLPGSAGNVALDRLVEECAKREIATGIDPFTLRELRRFVGTQTGLAALVRARRDGQLTLQTGMPGVPNDCL
jgi:hydroxymethylglutaryl-CoA lyase